MCVCVCVCLRCAYADLVKRLQVAEVQLERERRQRWEEALLAWRTLRSKHAMDLFKARIRYGIKTCVR